MTVLLHAMIQTSGARGVRIDSADFAVGQGIIAIAVVPDGDLEVAVAGRRLDHVEIRDAGRVFRAEIDHLVHPMHLLQLEPRAQSSALLVLVIFHNAFHVIQKLLHAGGGDPVVDVDWFEGRAGTPMISHPRVLAASLPWNRREEGLTGGTSRTGIGIATSDDEDVPQSLVEIER